MHRQFLIIVLMILPCFSTLAQNNQIGLNTGLFHYYFDDSPIINVNHVSKSQKGFYRGIFLNSWGIEYSRTIKEKNQLSLEISRFRKSYLKFVPIEAEHPNIGSRNFWTANFAYNRQLFSQKKFNLFAGAGLTWRYGQENVIVNVTYIGPEEFNIEELLIESVKRRDLGLSINTRCEYNFKNWLYAHSKIQFLSFVYFHDKRGIERLKSVYNVDKFPTKMDLSLKLGLGIRF